MSSEAITQNDLREILSRTVGSIPSEYKKLLWENPSPTATFSPQTVSLDLSDYDEVEIISKKSASENLYFITNSTIGVVNDTFLVQGGVSFDRQIIVNQTGIEFTTAYYLLPSSTAVTTDNNRCVPYQIYGIKYERVAPPQLDASDYVIEQGTNANGSYRKWNSGTMEQWGLEASASASAHNVSFPEAFISTAYIVVCSNTSGVQANFMPSSTNVAYFTVYPTASVQLYWIAMGRWK